MKIKEIFASIQGEGPYVGYKQLFIRFCGCNLHCSYFDTEFDALDAKYYTLEEVLKIIDSHKDCHYVSLTGGEPLLFKEFIKGLAKKSALPVYLETNGTMPEALSEVIDYVTYVSADIKLPCATGLNPFWKEHDQFFSIASEKKLFAKAVFNSEITEQEIMEMSFLCKKYGIELILQPMMEGIVPTVDSDFMQQVLDRCLQYYPKVRLIPQVHKFINVI